MGKYFLFGILFLLNGKNQLALEPQIDKWIILIFTEDFRAEDFSKQGKIKILAVQCEPSQSTSAP